tara:strand:- start:1564 stop:2382 length:819 start_codon:yes stop_codon:yes gene_type:complete
MAYIGSQPPAKALTSSDFEAGAVDAAALATNAVTTAKIINSATTNDKLAGSIANAKLSNSAITINGSAISLGGSVTVGETKPTISSISPTVITNTATAVTITGTNYQSIPYVDAINSSTGSITTADSVTYTSGTTIVATFTLSVDGTYYIRIENNDGLAVRSGSALLTVSDEPAWVTASGSLGTFAGNVAITTQTLTATDATSFAITSGAIATGLTFSTGVGAATITGTQTQYSAATTNNFTVTATDAQGQTSARAFSMTWSFGATGGAAFC